MIHEARWDPWERLGLVFRVSADRFLHHMVRYLVGTMVEIARGKRPLADLRGLLEEPAGELVTSPPAPPTGLFLHHVTYPTQPPAGESSPQENPHHRVNTD
jgi:tRNA pseudouridine38-40 synthase